FRAADHAERQSRCEDDAWLGVEAGRGTIMKVGAAKHALKTAQQIVMADQAQVATLAKADAEFAERQVATRPGWARGSDWLRLRHHAPFRPTPGGACCSARGMSALRAVGPRCVSSTLRLRGGSGVPLAGPAWR